MAGGRMRSEVLSDHEENLNEEIAFIQALLQERDLLQLRLLRNRIVLQNVTLLVEIEHTLEHIRAWAPLSQPINQPNEEDLSSGYNSEDEQEPLVPVDAAPLDDDRVSPVYSADRASPEEEIKMDFRHHSLSSNSSNASTIRIGDTPPPLEPDTTFGFRPRSTSLDSVSSNASTEVIANEFSPTPTPSPLSRPVSPALPPLPLSPWPVSPRTLSPLSMFSTRLTRASSTMSDEMNHQQTQTRSRSNSV